jgi:hypothetical protein
MVCLKSSLQGSLYSNTEIEFQLPALPEGAEPNTIELQGIVNTLKEGADLSLVFCVEYIIPVST